MARILKREPWDVPGQILLTVDMGKRGSTQVVVKESILDGPNGDVALDAVLAHQIGIVHIAREGEAE